MLVSILFSASSDRVRAAPLQAYDPPIGELLINEESVPLSVVDVFAKTVFPAVDYCSPFSDKYVLNAFINQRLLANTPIVEKQVKPKPPSQPLAALPAIAPGKISADPNRSLVAGKTATLYIEREASFTAETDDTKSTPQISPRKIPTPQRSQIGHQRRQEFRQQLARLGEFSGASRADKQYIADMTRKVARHRKSIQTVITDAEVEHYYHSLLSDRDSRLVDVHAIQYRTLLLTSDDPQTVGIAVDMLANEGQLGTFPMLLTPEGRRLIPGAGDAVQRVWARLADIDPEIRGPYSIPQGSTFIHSAGSIGNHYPESYKLYYVYDNKFYPVIEREEDIPNISPDTFLRDDLYQVKLKERYRTLRKKAVITLDGKLVADAPEHFDCSTVPR
jgi:hypothetical protein